MSELQVLCIGEAMVELSLSPDTPDTAGLGFAGDTLNTAIYMKRSAPEMRVCYATKIGEDAISDRMLDFIQSEGIDTSFTYKSSTRVPGIYSIATDEAGERSFTYWRDLSAAKTILQEPGLTRDVLDQFDLVYLSGITLAILTAVDRQLLLGWLGDYRKQGGRVAFDCNYRPQLWRDKAEAQHTVLAALKVTDIALSGVDDECALFGDTDEQQVIARMHDHSIRAGALKRGGRGPRGLGGSTLETQPATKVVDSTAAGDSFNAGFLTCLLNGGNETEAMAAGHALANKVLEYRGAIIPKGAA